MKQLKLTSIIILGACAMLFSACDILVDGATQPAPLPTVATGGKVDPSEPSITDPVVEPTQITIINPIATEQPSDVSPTETQTPIQTPTPTPATFNNGCLAPAISDQLKYSTYIVQPGDTLFKIGLAANPQMTVDQVAQVNCITDVNRIEVGQEILIWTPIKPIGAHELIIFNDGPLGRIGRYDGLLEHGSLSFQMEVYGDEDLTVFSHTGQFPEITFTVARKSDLVQIDTFKTSERHYVNTDLRGKHVDLPGGGTYLMMATGNVNDLLKLEFILGGPTFPILQDPVELSGDNLLGLPIQGTNNIGEYNTYQFWGNAGNTLDLQPLSFGAEGSNLVMILENSAEEVVLDPQFGHGGQLVLPDTGLYTLYLFHGGSRDFVYGDYAFSLTLTDSNPPPKPEVQRIQFDPGTSGTTLVGVNAQDTVDRYVFTASAGQVADFTILADIFEKENVGIWLEDTAGNQLFKIYGPASSSILLPYSGDYFLIVYHGGSHGYLAGPYEVAFGITNPPTPVTNWPAPKPITYHDGTDSSRLLGQIELGSVSRYAFSGEVGAELQVSLLSAANLGAWIEDSAGNRLFNVYGRTVGVMRLPAAGDYFLTIYKGDSEAYLGGPYDVNFYLEGAGASEIQEPELLTLVDGKASINGQFDSEGRMRYVLYQDSGRAISILGESVSDARYELTLSGAYITGRAFNVPLYEIGELYKKLSSSGDYVLELYGQPNETFELSIESILPPAEPVAGDPQQVDFDPETNSVYKEGSNSNGQLDQFVFSATAGQTLTFDIIYIADQMITRLMLVDGNQTPIMIVQTRTDGIIDSYEIPETGDYYLVVMEPSNALNRYGSYAFELTLSD